MVSIVWSWQKRKGELDERPAEVLHVTATNQRRSAVFRDGAKIKQL